ncbi:MAG: hypothetical protein M3N00_02185, partial [Actinomycetota bacterium]|nr:hypothetical protein [Actinomycetota bacterium]
FGYDLGRRLERLPATAADEGLPELDVGFYDWVLTADHLSGESWIVATGLPTGEETKARARVAGIQERLNATSSSSSNAASLKAPRLRSNFRRVDYLKAIERAREYIAAGDIFQVNLSHRLEGEWDGADGRHGRSTNGYARPLPSRTAPTWTWGTSKFSAPLLSGSSS